MLPGLNGEEVKLTRTEYAVLKLLMQNPNRVVTKSVLLNQISEDTPDCTDTSLKMHVSNLRKNSVRWAGMNSGCRLGENAFSYFPGFCSCGEYLVYYRKSDAV